MNGQLKLSYVKDPNSIFAFLVLRRFPRFLGQWGCVIRISREILKILICWMSLTTQLRYHVIIHVDFQNLTKICKILIFIVTWVKSTRIWSSSREVRAVWSSALRNRTPPHFLKNVPDSRGLVGRSRVVGSTSVLDFIESMWDMRVTYVGILSTISSENGSEKR